MPLIPTQHVLTADGMNSDIALENFFNKTDDLPPVRVVSMSVLTRNVSSGIQAIKIVAVVEEV